jgi:ceramide glucosyltransferase
MTTIAQQLLSWCGSLLAAFAMGYSVIAWLAARAPVRSVPLTPREAPPVTMLKPLCGAETETYECLRSCCDQAYPEFQIVFGVAEPHDPAVAVVQRLQKEFPRRDLRIVVDRRQHGSSRKVSNLINMMPAARHEILVLSDSDVRVPRDYLAKVAAPLADSGVGIVTCPYLGTPRRGLWSCLGSMFINEWFTPSVRVAAMTGSRSFAFGATIAMRHQVLASIGGFTAIANQLADDYRLGESTRRLGLRTVLSEVVVETCVVERSFAELVRHELRWLRTIRAVRPFGYGCLFITFGVPVAAFGTALAGAAAFPVGMLAITILARVMLHLGTRRPGSSAIRLFIIPLRDILSIGLWAWGFATRRVRWRDDHYRVSRDGSALPV